MTQTQTPSEFEWLLQSFDLLGLDAQTATNREIKWVREELLRLGLNVWTKSREPDYVINVAANGFNYDRRIVLTKLEARGSWHLGFRVGGREVLSSTGLPAPYLARLARRLLQEELA